jgi:hypothetical protein
MRLSMAAREQIFRSTGGKCHICGGVIDGKWQADHVKPHSAGGTHSIDNYLPAHATCNNYRWDYLPEEFELILKLGVWSKTQVMRGTKIGKAIQEQFAKHEGRRTARRKLKG